MKARLRTKLIGAVVLYVLLLAGVGWLGLSAAQSSLDGMHAAIQHHVREVAMVVRSRVRRARSRRSRCSTS